MIVILPGDVDIVQQLSKEYGSSVTTKSYQYRGYRVLSVQSSNLDLLERIRQLNPTLNEEVSKY